MNIWIINHYASSSFFDEGGRHYYISDNLKKYGHYPVVFCSNAKHGTGEVFFEDITLWQRKEQTSIDVPYVFIKSRPYIGNGKNRILCMIDFYNNVRKTAEEYANIYGKPDIVYASSVHPLAIVAGIKIAKKYGIKCISEVRDLWPETFLAYGFIGPKNPVLYGLRAFEKSIYKKSDFIIFTAEGCYDYIRERGWEKAIPKSKVGYINNGIDLELFEYNKNRFVFGDEDLDNDNQFNIVYTGSIRRINNLSGILNVAKEINDPKVRFLIWGDGDELEVLKKRQINEHISNVVFKGRVEKKYIPSITSKASINYAHNGNSPLFRFGLSFNKIFDYLAAGRPILCDFKSNYNPVIMGGAGVAVESADPKEIANQITRFVDMDNQEYQAFCEAAKQTSKEYDFFVLTNRLLEIIAEVNKNEF